MAFGLNLLCVSGLATLLMCGVVPSSSAQTVTPDQEYSRYLTAAQTITPVTEFGDQVSLRDGGLSFRQVDVELPGTGPTIRIVRTFRVADRAGRIKDTSGNSMGEWELALPRLKTLTNASRTTSGFYGPYGWQVSEGSDARCTQINGPGTVTRSKVDPVEPETWWAGYQLVEDSGEEENVLAHSPAPSQPTHVARTKGNWLIACLSSTSNGQPGEAFLAIAPDGTRYWLDYLVYKTAPSVSGLLARNYGSMLVTRVEDRFGNWVTYHYSAGILDAIDASDGRHVSLTNNGYNITSVTVASASGNRTWQYGYTTEDRLGALTSVVLPDGASWQFSLDSLFYIGIPPQSSGNCYGTAQNDGLTGTPHTGGITAPSGATATYSVRVLHIGRSYVSKVCWSPDGANTYAEIPKDSWAFAITSKTVSGAGLPQATWTYNYSPGNSSWNSDCGSGCVSTVWTDVTEPDGTRHRSIFGNKFDGAENLLQRTETYAAQSGVLIQAKDISYAISPLIESNSPYPWRSVGFDFTPRSNWAVSERWTPMLSTMIAQDGVTFSSHINGYDTYARPTSVTKSSAPSP